MKKTNSQIKPRAKFRIDSFAQIRKIGEGSYAEVYLVMHDISGLLYAMKILSKEKIIYYNKQKQPEIERKVLHSTNHPNIIKLHYALHNKKNLDRKSVV